MRSKEMGNAHGDNIHSEEDFDRAYEGRTWSWYRHVLADCIAKSKPGKILDIGSGLGYFAECALQYGLECIGIDGSTYATKKALARNPNLNLLVCNLADLLPFEDEVFSTVVLHQVAEHLNQQVLEKTLREAYRVLEKGGVLLVYSPSINSKEARREPTHINLLTPSKLKKKVVDTGFSSCESFDAPVRVGLGRFGHYLGYVLFKLSPDRFSATTNLVACK